tara:strand:+ start:17 stop:925 length:909 start_codon:yes stop_codon:yes gene_type:complete
MFRIFLFLLLVIPFNVYSNESLLTIQQQLERLQREVSDLSQTVYSKENESVNPKDSDKAINLSAIDMRIYDLEKDIKNLTGTLEEIFFLIEDLKTDISEFESIFSSLEKNISKLENKNQTSEIQFANNNSENNDENTLGSLKITSNNTVTQDTEDIVENTQEQLNETEVEKNILPEEQFQIAFENIRNKNWDEAKVSFINFIENNPENQLAGSAHYWLGELHILEKKYREAAIVLAEGYQKFPESIKAPDMLLKLSQSLYNVEKIDESCKMLEELIQNYSKNKLVKNAKKQSNDFGCIESIE